MADSIYSGYPPILSSEQEAYLTQVTKDWSIEHGLTVRPSPSFISPDIDRHGILATNAPVTLFPSPFPQSCFEHARSLQTIYNALYAAVANDEDWLQDVLKEYDFPPPIPRPCTYIQIAHTIFRKSCRLLDLCSLSPQLIRPLALPQAY